MNLYYYTIKESDLHVWEAYKRGETAISVDCYQLAMIASGGHDILICTEHSHIINREQAIEYLLHKAFIETEQG